MTIIVTLRGPRAIIQDLENEDFPGIEKDERQSGHSLADAVDSPIGAQELEQILQLLTVGISTATAAVALLERIKKLLSSQDKPSKVDLVDPTTNKVRASIAPDSDISQIVDDLF
jgi:hypothetical protein